MEPQRNFDQDFTCFLRYFNAATTAIGNDYMLLPIAGVPLPIYRVVTVPAPEVQPTDQVIGVDLGINRPAVTSSGRFLGQRRWKAIEGRYFRQIRALQKKGSKSAKRHLRKLKRRRARFRKDADHVLSK